jgi:hypothetical protein
MAQELPDPSRMRAAIGSTLGMAGLGAGTEAEGLGEQPPDRRHFSCQLPVALLFSADAEPRKTRGIHPLVRATHYRGRKGPGANPLKDAHAALDAAVLAAYGFSAKKDLLAQLLALNLEVAARIEKGEPVTAPGMPANYPEPKMLVTEDCIKPC